MLNPVHAKQFKKDYKLAKSRSKSMKKLIDSFDLRVAYKYKMEFNWFVEIL